MRLSLTFLTLALASGALAAADNQRDFHWAQVQGGVTGHGFHNPDNYQPAVGLGVGTWLNDSWGVEGSALGSYVSYGQGKAKELQAHGSVLFNPSASPSNIRPFFRLGVGPTRTGSPVSGTGEYTTRLSGVAGVGMQILSGPHMLYTLEGRMVEVETRFTRKEGQALAGFGFRWGGRPTSVAASTPAPAAPEPELLAEVPNLVVVPVPAPTQSYCTILDLQFAIDRDAIQVEDREKLKVVGTFMTQYPATTAIIEGHSDNVGDPAHNQELSTQRAASVVTYLVDTLHIDPVRLSAVGYGDTRPVADNSTQEGKRQNRRIDAVIACVTDVAGLTVAPARVTMALAIEFEPNKAEVKPGYDAELAKVGDFLKANPTVTAWVEGHTGNLQATPKQAMAISRQRAQNVVDYLVDHQGIERSRLSAQGFSNNRLFAYNTSAEGAQENRRVNIIFNYAK